MFQMGIRTLRDYDYRITTLSEEYLTMKEIIIPNLKFI